MNESNNDMNESNNYFCQISLIVTDRWEAGENQCQNRPISGLLTYSNLTHLLSNAQVFIKGPKKRVLGRPILTLIFLVQNP